MLQYTHQRIEPVRTEIIDRYCGNSARKPERDRKENREVQQLERQRTEAGEYIKQVPQQHAHDAREPE